MVLLMLIVSFLAKPIRPIAKWFGFLLPSL